MNFEKEVSTIIEALSDDVHQALDQTGKELAKWGVNELKDKPPKKTGKYAKGWHYSKKGKTYIIKNKIYYLTHLLEYGHAKVNGGRVDGIPHIKPVEKAIKEKAEAEFRGKLK